MLVRLARSPVQLAVPRGRRSGSWSSRVVDLFFGRSLTHTPMGYKFLRMPEHRDFSPATSATSLTRQAVSATLHCLTGCAIGEVLGLVIATALGWADLPSIALAIALAFVFGYAFTVHRSCVLG